MLIKVSAGADTTILERILAVIVSLRKREKSHLPAKKCHHQKYSFGAR